MAPIAGEVPTIDVVDDGLSDEAVADRFATWLSDVEDISPVGLPVTAADELDRAYVDEDV